MSVNRYLQRLIHHSPSPAVQGAAKIVHKAGTFVNAVTGSSANKALASANAAKHVSAMNPSSKTNQFAKKLDSIAKDHVKQRNEARVVTGLAVGGAGLAHKALQNASNNVQYDSYPTYY